MDADRHKWPMARQGFAQIGWLWLLSEDERFSTLPGLPAGRRVANLETKLLKALFVSFVTSSVSLLWNKFAHEQDSFANLFQLTCMNLHTTTYVQTYRRSG